MPCCQLVNTGPAAKTRACLFSKRGRFTLSAIPIMFLMLYMHSPLHRYFLWQQLFVRFWPDDRSRPVSQRPGVHHEGKLFVKSSSAPEAWPLSYLSGSDAPYTVRMDSKSHSLTRIRNLIPQHALIISLPTRTQISLLTRTHISRLIRTHISLPTRFPNLTSHTDS